MQYERALTPAQKWRLFYLQTIHRPHCRCGHFKPPGYPFCHRCMGRLPGKLKADLFRYHEGDDYQPAYTAACHYLEGANIS